MITNTQKQTRSILFIFNVIAAAILHIFTYLLLSVNVFQYRSWTKACCFRII